MLSFVILFFAAIELAPVPMVSFIILPLILCTMHSESADIALAGIVNILAVIHTLHIVAYLTFALMARSYAFPISPIMLGLVFGPIAAFLGTCMPMVYFIIAPFIAIIMFLLVSALALAANDHMIFLIKLLGAAIELALVPMGVLIVLPLILCTMHSESADIALAGIVNILAVIHTLHIVAYLTFALMARSYAFPISPIMLGFVKHLGAAFKQALVPMLIFIVLPFVLCTVHGVAALVAPAVYQFVIELFLGVAAFRSTMVLMSGSNILPVAPAMLMRFFVTAFAYAVDEVMCGNCALFFAAFVQMAFRLVIRYCKRRDLLWSFFVHIAVEPAFMPMLGLILVPICTPVVYMVSAMLTYGNSHYIREHAVGFVPSVYATDSAFIQVMLFSIVVQLAIPCMLMVSFIATNCADISALLGIFYHLVLSIADHPIAVGISALIPMVLVVMQHFLARYAFMPPALVAYFKAAIVYPIMLFPVFLCFAAFNFTLVIMVFFIIAPFLTPNMFMLSFILYIATNFAYPAIFLIAHKRVRCSVFGAHALVNFASMPMASGVILPFFFIPIMVFMVPFVTTRCALIYVVACIYYRVFLPLRSSTQLLTITEMLISAMVPWAPLMLGLVFGPIAAFLGACMPMVGRIVLPLGFPVMLMRLFVFAYAALAVDNGMHAKVDVPFAAFMRASVPMVIGVIRPICISFVLMVYLVSASRANICTVSDFLPCMCSGGFGVMHVAAFVFAHMEVLIWNCRPLIAPFMLYVAPFVAALCAYIVAVAVRRFGIDMFLYIAVMRSAYFAGLIVDLRQRHLVAYPLGSIGIIQMVFLITAYA